MKVTPNVVPTPIASTMALQLTRAEPQERPADPIVAAPIPAQPKSEAAPPPLTVDLTENKRIELAQGEVAKVVEKMNETARLFNNKLRFEMTNDNRVKIRVVDSQTGHLVREIPPERLMETFTRLEDLVGVLLDHRA